MHTPFAFISQPRAQCAHQLLQELNGDVHGSSLVEVCDIDYFSDVGSILNLGARHFKGTFSLRKRGPFLKTERALLCSLQALGGHIAQCSPRFLHLWIISLMAAS